MVFTRSPLNRNGPPQKSSQKVLLTENVLPKSPLEGKSPLKKSSQQKKSSQENLSKVLSTEMVFTRSPLNRNGPPKKSSRKAQDFFLGSSRCNEITKHNSHAPSSKLKSQSLVKSPLALEIIAFFPTGWGNLQSRYQFCSAGGNLAAKRALRPKHASGLKI